MKIFTEFLRFPDSTYKHKQIKNKIKTTITTRLTRMGSYSISSINRDKHRRFKGTYFLNQEIRRVEGGNLHECAVRDSMVTE